MHVPIMQNWWQFTQSLDLYPCMIHIKIIILHFFLGEAELTWNKLLVSELLFFLQINYLYSVFEIL